MSSLSDKEAEIAKLQQELLKAKNLSYTNSISVEFNPTLKRSVTSIPIEVFQAKWYINVYLNSTKTHVSCYAHRSASTSSSYHEITFILKHPSDSSKDFKRCFEHEYPAEDRGRGYPEFASLLEHDSFKHNGRFLIQMIVKSV
ncbi:hypothetical protein RCL1_001877 [Eukaryota sp. TZLM3-RCL]